MRPNSGHCVKRVSCAEGALREVSMMVVDHKRLSRFPEARRRPARLQAVGLLGRQEGLLHDIGSDAVTQPRSRSGTVQSSALWTPTVRSPSRFV